MSKKSELTVILEAVAKMQQEFVEDPAKAKAFLRSVLGPPMRKIEGQEYDDIMLLLKLATPFRTSNNQRTETNEYRLAGKLYHVTYGLSDKPELEEVEED